MTGLFIQGVNYMEDKVIVLIILFIFLSIIFILSFCFLIRCIVNLSVDFDRLKKECKNMLDKNEIKVSKLNFYCDKCFCFLASMKIANNEEDFKERKEQFLKYFEMYIKEKQMLIDFDKLLGD